MDKILIISNNPFYGGGEAFILSTLKPLEKYYSLTYLVKNQKLKEKLKDNVNIIKADNFIEQIKEIKQFIKKFNPNLLIFNGGSSLYISIFINEKKILIRHSTNDGISLKNTPKLWIHKILLHLSYLKANKIIHVSDFSRKEQYIAKHKAITIHNGIKLRPSIIRNISRPIRFLYVGRIDKSKGIDIIIKAFSSFSIKDVTLDVVGDGTLIPELKKKLPPTVTLHGFSDHPETFYPKADVFITLPQYENLSLSVLEAMNNSMMIISNNVGGMPELIQPNQNGIFIKRTLEDTINIINYTIQHPNIVNKYGSYSKTLCDKKFNLLDKIEKYNQIINELLK